MGIDRRSRDSSTPPVSKTLPIAQSCWVNGSTTTRLGCEMWRAGSVAAKTAAKKNHSQMPLPLKQQRGRLPALMFQRCRHLGDLCQDTRSKPTYRISQLIPVSHCPGLAAAALRCCRTPRRVVDTELAGLCSKFSRSSLGVSHVSEPCPRDDWKELWGLGADEMKNKSPGPKPGGHRMTKWQRLWETAESRRTTLFGVLTGFLLIRLGPT